MYRNNKDVLIGERTFKIGSAVLVGNRDSLSNQNASPSVEN